MNIFDLIPLTPKEQKNRWYASECRVYIRGKNEY